MHKEVSSTHLDALIEKVENRSLTAGIVGLGYVGLPIAQLFTSQGFNVLGLDIDQSKIRKLMSGESYIGHIPASVIQQMLLGDRLVATTDFARAAKADTLSICVPTPLDKSRQPDLTAVRETVKSFVPHLASWPTRHFGKHNLSGHYYRSCTSNPGEVWVEDR